jgi:hypothetical protein
MSQTMSHDDRERLLTGYIEHMKSGLEVNESTFWAWEALDDLIRESPTEAADIISELVRRVESNWLLTIIGTGPLEDLLVSHGDDLVGWAEQHARDDSKFAAALSMSDLRGGPMHVLNRIARLLKKLGVPS